MIPADLSEILRCPQTGQALAVCAPELLAELNRRIALSSAGGIHTLAGQPVARPLDGGLVRLDGGALYPVWDDIPVLLVEEAIPLPLP